MLDGLKYHWITNTDKGSKTHVGYQELKKNGQARVIFGRGTDAWGRRLPKTVSIWLAIDDKEIAKQKGLFV